jgi:hypothetical protein
MSETDRSSDKFGSLITFYSWKGGVGRTFALANTAIQLARFGHDVLMVDFDLEAPGLDRYFLKKNQEIPTGLVARAPRDNSGLIGLLSSASAAEDGGLHAEQWRRRLYEIDVPSLKSSYRRLTPPLVGKLSLLPSGYGQRSYSENISGFSWDHFFAIQQGGKWLESVREQWREDYDFILIDSRTGLTDIGGICTIQMPDILVLVFTTNEQSLDGGLRVVESAQKEREDFAFDRGPLSVLPLLSRWDGDSEVDLAEEWMKRIDRALKPLTGSWLPTIFTPRDFLEKVRVPHVARFSFGEPLPVLTHSLNDQALPSHTIDLVAQLLEGELGNAGTLIDPNYVTPEIQTRDQEAQRLSEVTDDASLYREIARRELAAATTQQDKANAYIKLGDSIYRISFNSPDENLLREATRAYQNGLTEISRERLPRDWAGTQNNLGNTLQEMGKRASGAEGMELLERSMGAYEAALEVNTRGEMPADWAGTQNNLGNTLQEMGNAPAGRRGWNCLSVRWALMRLRLR